MSEVIKTISGHRIVEDIQDIAYYSFNESWLFSLEKQIELSSCLRRTWHLHLGSLVHINDSLKNIIDSNKKISLAINWGLREYQIEKNINTLLSDRRIDDEFRDESKRPFIVKYDLDSENVEFHFSKECFDNYLITLTFYDDVFNKRFDKVKDFIYKYYAIEEDKKDEVNKSIEMLSKLLCFDNKCLEKISKLKELLS